MTVALDPDDGSIRIKLLNRWGAESHEDFENDSIQKDLNHLSNSRYYKVDWKQKVSLNAKGGRAVPDWNSPNTEEPEPLIEA